MEILRTNNYDMFKFKKENREINYNKVNNLKRKLIDDGRQIMPIICNKNMEIIDGQHRFEALKELGWDVMYYIDEGVTSYDLISINNTQTNWSLNDYIHYWATLGNETFINIEKYVKIYESLFPLKVILAAFYKRYVKERIIKAGSLSLSETEYREGEKCLEFLKQLKENIRYKVNNQFIFYFLVIKTYYLDGIDKDKLFNNVVSRYGTENYGNSEQCAIVLEHFYNYKSKNYRYISNEILPRR